MNETDKLARMIAHIAFGGPPPDLESVRDKAFYRRMLDDNPNINVNIFAAARMILASQDIIDPELEAMKPTISRLKDQYGREELTPAEVRHEMGLDK